MSFTCTECFDTETIDQGGAEIPCPYCVAAPVVQDVLIRGLAHGLGYQGGGYRTAAQFSSSTITFRGTRTAILNEVTQVRQAAEHAARRAGETGRNSISSGAIAIERHVRKALS